MEEFGKQTEGSCMTVEKNRHPFRMLKAVILIGGPQKGKKIHTFPRVFSTNRVFGRCEAKLLKLTAEQLSLLISGADVALMS